MRKVFIAVVVLGLLASTAHAEWMPAGLSGRVVRTLVETPAGTRFACAGDGLFRSADAGQSWQQIGGFEFSDAFSAVVESDSGQVFLAVESGVYRSDDEGVTWTRLAEQIIGAYSLGVAPNRHIFAAGSTGIWRSTDRGRSWVFVRSELGSFTDGVTFDRDGRVFVTSVMGDLIRSEDDGATWDTLPVPEYKRATAVSPLTGTIFAATQTFDTPSMRSVYRSIDHGETWQLVDRQPGSIECLFVVSNGDVLSGSDIVARSADDGLTWPNDQGVTGFAQLRGEVFVGYGFTGLWRDAGLVSVEAPARPPAVALRAAPNPCAARATLSLALPSAGRAKLEVFGVDGRRVAILIDGELPAGAHTVAFDTTRLAVGVYFARLAHPRGTTTTRLLVAR